MPTKNTTIPTAITTRRETDVQILTGIHAMRVMAEPI
jgi:hypothetical protein